jgi:two-component system cell cycle response regulator DivK
MQNCPEIGGNQVLSPRVLVVEDNEKNSKLACAVLETAGIDTIVATTGAAAVDHCAQQIPHAVLLDIQLPDKPGSEVLLDLRALPEMQSVPVIAVTAFAMTGDRERLLGDGFDGYIAKPIDVATFADTVRSYLRSGDA